METMWRQIGSSLAGKPAGPFLSGPERAARGKAARETAGDPRSAP
jgi:hypothetical protein